MSDTQSDKHLNRRDALRLGISGAALAGAASAGLATPGLATADEAAPVEAAARPRFEDLAAANRHRLGDPVAHRRAIARADEVARREGLVQLPERKLAGDIVLLTQYQTGFRNQGARGTCFAFAAVAGMEAAYKRKYGVELDLSEHYAFHIGKAGELYPDYVTNPARHENNSSYWGFQGSSDIVDLLARAAIPEESLVPYLSGADMDRLRTSTPACGNLDWNSTQEELDAFEYLEANVSTRARHFARYRVTRFGALPWSPSSSQIESVIAGGHEVVADVPGHCVLIVGFDRRRRVYVVKNSWGEGRFIELGYDSKDWPILAGRYVIDVDDRNAAPQWDAGWIGRWKMDHDGWRGDLVIRRTTGYRSSQGQPTKLGNYYRDGRRYDVNGLTVQNGQGLRFWVADTTDRVEPGARRGQEFHAYLFSWDKVNAAGTTTWSGIPFGVSLSRSDLPGRPTRGFVANDWIGRWAMNHDGWRGTLNITSAQPLSATYVASDGRSLPVSGGVEGGRPHVLRIVIPFASDNRQQFQLFAHTWEKEVFSGLTQWGGLNFGVQGRRT
ncbi:C1 family peptidase [Streptoalloteichus hindustanus]|uniref:Papain family cysteine protease n=1 Tax=Streptoalloteichus hindustanus TaxID=2017 RepID=A0A1M5F0M0_STRHI|nr:hypothetical protein [Streptoalloteichus hindustanus]SHF84771.1 hypothetical protein SAMN05444320_105214 [Streptoalloteichus hindustanus]